MGITYNPFSLEGKTILVTGAGGGIRAGLGLTGGCRGGIFACLGHISIYIRGDGVRGVHPLRRGSV